MEQVSRGGGKVTRHPAGAEKPVWITWGNGMLVDPAIGDNRCSRRDTQVRPRLTSGAGDGE